MHNIMYSFNVNTDLISATNNKRNRYNRNTESTSAINTIFFNMSRIIILIYVMDNSMCRYCCKTNPIFALCNIFINYFKNTDSISETKNIIEKYYRNIDLISTMNNQLI